MKLDQISQLIEIRNYLVSMQNNLMVTNEQRRVLGSKQTEIDKKLVEVLSTQGLDELLDSSPKMIFTTPENFVDVDLPDPFKDSEKVQKEEVITVSSSEASSVPLKKHLKGFKRSK